MLDAVQHQVEREDGHTEDGPAANGHLLLQFHPPLLIRRMLMSRSRAAETKEESVNLCKSVLMKPCPKSEKMQEKDLPAMFKVHLCSPTELQILKQGLVG